MISNNLKKNSINIILLILLFLITFSNYIIKGGLLRDDMGVYCFKSNYKSYFEYQKEISTSYVMTSRPVSAIIIGFCYWTFNNNSRYLHFINLSLFFITVLLFYFILKKYINSPFAFMTAGFVLIYPTASSTLYSFILINFNAAGFFWILSLYLDTFEYKNKALIFIKELIIIILIVFSSLSYESFVPLFLINVLLRFYNNRKRLSFFYILKLLLPFLFSASIFIIYRIFLEKLLFYSSYSRISVSRLNIVTQTDYLTKVINFVVLWFKFNFFVIPGSFSNFFSLSLFYLLILIIFVIIYYFYLKKDFDNIDIDKRKAFYILIFSIVSFLISNFIFLFSNYRPATFSYDNRIMGSIRFTLIFLIISFLNYLTVYIKNKKIILYIYMSIFIIYFIGVKSQSNAWIGASEYNKEVLKKIKSIYNPDENIENRFCIYLPKYYPEHVNGELIFGEHWDLEPSLKMIYPNYRFKADVINSDWLIIENDKIILHGRNEIFYPFYFYNYLKEDKIYKINNKDELIILL
ncbi:MAG: hypothetical protein JXB50_11125 [Spirochaetes bacterium]|nr:hypothetical protein [Spirochaetota bacterium]